MKKYLKASKLIVCLLLFKNTIGQNLIRNGSFENYHTPINWNWWGGDFIGYYTWPGDTVLVEWTEQNSADLFLSASTNTFAGVPQNKDGHCYAQDGNNYCGFLAYAPSEETKEYISQHLSSPLVSGQTYCASFYVSCGDAKEYAIKNIGAYFSNTIPSVTPLSYALGNPQIENQTGYLTDTTGWTEIQGCFTANGSEQYITIGNFNSGANTDAIFVGTNNPVYPSAMCYYYIDNIQLWNILTTDIEDLKGNLITIYPNPSNGKLEINSIVGANYSVVITNTIGQVNRIIQIQRSNTEIDLSNEPSGIYFCNLLQNGKILKQNKIVLIK